MTVKKASELGTASPAYLVKGAALPQESKEEYNIIYNGDLDIWQRATSSTTLGYTGPDRFQYRGGFGTGTFTAEKVIDFIPGVGRMNAVKITHTAAGTLNGRLVFAQPIPYREWQRTSGKVCTMSFWAKADSPVPIASEMAMNTSIAGVVQAADGNTFPLEYAKLHSITTSWQRFTHTFTSPSPDQYVDSWDLGGTQWPVFIYLTANYDATNPNGQNRSAFITDHAGVVYMTGFRLEVGVSSPSTFKKTPSYDKELRRCKAFYQKTFPLTTAPVAGAAKDGCLIATAPASSPAQTITANWAFDVPMHKVPTVTTFTPTGASTTTGGWASTNTTEVAALPVNTTTFGTTIINNAATPAAIQRLDVHAVADAELP